MGIHPGLPTKDVYAFDPCPCPNEKYQGADAQQEQDCGENQLEKASFPVAHVEIVKPQIAKQQRQHASQLPTAGLLVIQTEYNTAAVFARFLLIGNPSAAMGAVAGAVAFGKAAMIAGKGFFPQFLAAILTIHECSSYGMLI